MAAYPATADSLACPQCRGALEAGESQLRCSGCGSTFAIKNGIPRFVEMDNYASSFGMQWNTHRSTQLDSHNGTTISRDRLFAQTQWSPDELRGKRLLECGSGAGRFSEVLCSMGAEVYSIDISHAVDANRENNRRFSNLHLYQASIFDLPFPDESFDYLFCFGVIQHTPDVERAVKSMLRCLRRGGKFSIDVYAAPYAYLHPRHLLRPMTKRLPPETLYRWIERAVPLLMPISSALHRIPVVGEAAARLIPVANWRKHLPITDDHLWREWAVLDTFDWLSPAFETPQTRKTLQKWLDGVGVQSSEISRWRGLYVMRGIK